VDELARRADLPLDAARRLLAAAAAIGLLERSGDAYALGAIGAQIHGSPGILSMVRHHALFYADLADPVALLRGTAQPTRLANYWPYANAAEPGALTAESTAAYTRLMSASQSFIARDVVAALSPGRHRVWLDVGGGDGTFLAALAEQAPHLDLMLFDLPPVAAIARERLSAAGIGARVRVVAGDFLRDPLPTGADAVSFVRVLHDHDEARVAALLRAARAALPKNGVIVIAEPLAAVPGAEAMSDAYFGLYLLAMGRGAARTPAQYAALLAQAGFDSPRLVPTPIPLQTSVLIAPVTRR
jgi:demethylspheroidene O-methyltransferase